jgi:hypothetical protein
MPELQQPPQLKDVDLERIKFLFSGDQSPDDNAAAKLVTTTFSKYESQRLTVERRWDTAARLYHGVIDQRKWEGTNVDRAALAVPIVYDQVESAHPIIAEALFSYWPTFFEVTPLPGTTPREAAEVRDVLAAQLETPNDESGITPITHMKMALKQAEKYGDGVLEISWDAERKRAIVEWRDVRDIYIDFTATGPAADWTPALIDRTLMTVQDLKDLRGTEGVNIPSDEVLNWFAKSRFITSGDMSKEREAAARKEALYIGELRADPRHQLVEVLKYITKDRVIWVLGRMWTAINAENPYGFINYVRAPYTMVEGRPYSMSLADVLEGEQKYAQGIRNARLDNLSLIMNPPRKRAQGTPTNASKLAWRPGLIDEISDAKQAEVYKVENATADAYQEEQFIHSGASRRTGVNEMVQSGIPTPSNANRSATGVAAQQKSVGTRLSTAVGNFEDFMIVPMLYKIAKMIAKFAPESFSVVDKLGNTINSGRETFKKGFLFRMEAANRMLVKERLAMFLAPVSTLLFNDAVMKQANLQGMTLDFSEWARFFQDATGTSRAYSFFRAMSPQEQQAMNQPDPKMMLEMQKAQMEAQVRREMGQMKMQTEDQKAKLDYAARTQGVSEKSAVELVKLLQKERADAWSRNDKSKSGRDSGSR